MKTSEDRYRRELRRHDLALRMIRHEVRTLAIQAWTGLTANRVRRLYRHYYRDALRPNLARHRGPAPRQAIRFLRTQRTRAEAAAAIGICYAMGVLPPGQTANARKTLPSLVRGERLCTAYERFQALVPETELRLEHVIIIALAVVQRAELILTHCVGCGALVLLDELGVMRRRCAHCARSPDEEVADPTSRASASSPRSSERPPRGTQGRLFR
jgi:hypothetical protein